MTLSDYLPLALRTESVLDAATLTGDQRQAELRMRSLLEHDLVALGAKLDVLKRVLFYRKGTASDEGVLLPLQDSEPYNDKGLRLLHGVVGLVTEVAELAESLTHKDSGTFLDTGHLAEELGDLNWYLALIFDAIGANPEQVLAANLAKLRARYPTRFDATSAVERDLDQERDAMNTVLDPRPEAERIEAVLRAAIGDVMPQKVPNDLARHINAPPAFVSERMNLAMHRARDAWILEATPLLIGRLDPDDLRLLEGADPTPLRRARESLLSALGELGLNARFMELVEKETDREAQVIAGTLMPSTLPEG